MEKIGLVVESIVDMPQDLIDKYQIVTVPVKLYWPEIEGMPGENIFQKMRELERRGRKSFGKTSQPSMKDFLDKYNSQLEKFDKVLCITITSKLSGSYNSAIQAQKFLEPENQERVFVIDSLSGISGHALIVLKAAELIEEGNKIDEVVKEVKEFLPKVHFHLMLADPKYLEAIGRISSLVASVLREMGKRGIRPFLGFKNGTLGLSGLKIHARDIPTAMFKTLEAETKKLRQENKKIRLVINHGDDSAGVQRLREMIGRELKNIEIAFITILDDVIGGPLGPDTIACAWHEI
jgi:DegV family protein with EDD domain